MSNTLWAAKITLKSGRSWLYVHGIGFTRAEAKDNYLKSGRVGTDKHYGSTVTFVKVDVLEQAMKGRNHAE
jgi:beta-xylosidase